MGAFTSFPQFTPAASQAVALPTTPLPAMPGGVDPYQEPVLRAESREALIRAGLEAEEAALRAEQERAEAAAAADAATEGGRVQGNLARDLEARGQTLRRDQGASTADAAARGILSGGTSRALLKGLEREATSDAEAARLAASQRLEDIRRGLDVQRQRNLLSLAEQQRRNQLAGHAASADTTFTRRETWLRQASDRQREVDEYQRKVDAYNRELVEYNRRAATQAATERSRTIGKVTDTLLGAVLPRLG